MDVEIPLPSSPLVTCGRQDSWPQDYESRRVLPGPHWLQHSGEEEQDSPRLGSRVELTLRAWLRVSDAEGVKAGELALALLGAALGELAKAVLEISLT